MHILLISDNFYPETNAPASRGFEHCKVWVSQGHKVTVITSFPNFPRGKVYSGYKNKLYQFENIKGINILRVWTYMAPNSGIWKRMLDQLSFMITAFFGGVFLKNIDVVIGTTPHIFTPVSAVLISKIKNIKFILELRDLWPDSMVAVGMDNKFFLFKLAKFLEKKLYFSAHKIIPVTNSFSTYLIKMGIPKSNIKVVMNGVDISFFDFKKSKYIKRSSKIFQISYIGTIGMAHSIHTIVEAANIMKNDFYDLPIKFQIIGDGAERKTIEKEIYNLENIILLPLVPKEKIIEYLDRSDLGIIHLKKNDLFKTVIPSKMFEYMAMGIPILHGVLGESYEIIRKHNLGIYFEAENPQDLCASIIKLYNEKSLYNEISKNCVKTSFLFNRESLALDMLLEIKKAVRNE